MNGTGWNVTVQPIKTLTIPTEVEPCSPDCINISANASFMASAISAIHKYGVKKVMKKVNDLKNKLVNDISQCSMVVGVGQTGDMNAKLVPGNSDIDLFVLCTAIPTENRRKQIYAKYSMEYTECQMNVCSGGIWGYGDILIIDGIDVMFMYFMAQEMEQYLNEVLQGKHLDNVGGFYPTGRLSSIESINILYETDETWTRLKKKVTEYPIELFNKLFQHHIARVINDEDLGRVFLRKEVMFYHQVLENSLDHLLQALYAINYTYFPSRKRTEQYINSFKYKPQDCYDRILQIIKSSASDIDIEMSGVELKKIANETKQIGNMVFNIFNISNSH